MSIIKVKSRGTDNVSGRRNIAYNGAMQVAQRGTSQTAISSGGYYTVDLKYPQTLLVGLL